MPTHVELLEKQIREFIDRTPAGLLQLLVGAARKSTFRRIIDCPTYPVPAKTSGLSLAIRQLRDVLNDPSVHLPTFFARLYGFVRPIVDRKLNGQFFTSEEIAQWALSIEKPLSTDDVCDAGSGTAVFADAILSSGKTVRSYIGVENDPILTLCAAHVLENIEAPDSYKVWYANFLLLDEAAFKGRGLRLPSFIIANPPFVRYHHLTGRAQMRSALKPRLGITLSSLSGSGSYFLLRAAELAGFHHLSSDARPYGRLLFFFPIEAAGAKHTRHLRTELLRSHGWNCREHRIPNGQTGIDRHRSNALGLLFAFEQNKVPINLESQESKPSSSLGELLRIRRGISTGCNDFFVLTDDEARRRKIPRKRLREVLPTRIRITSKNFSREEWDRLRISGHRCWLLALPNGKIDDFETPVQEYLKEGLRRGLHATPTAKALRTWFSLPVPAEPPDLFVTYFFRGQPRFILNSARVIHLTNILGGKFLAGTLDENIKERIVDSLDIQAERWMKSDTVGREYKGGLKKIEPRELSKLPINSSLLKVANRGKTAAAGRAISLFDLTSSR